MYSLKDFLAASYTPYHAVRNCAEILEGQGFVRIAENKKWEIAAGGKYYVVKDGSSLIAFVAGEKGFNIIASHSDSPAFKLKGSPSMGGEYLTLNSEVYGGGLFYSYLDRPLKPAGRVVYYDEEKGKVCAQVVTASFDVVIPSLAIHLNREANKSLSLNPQTDMIPLASLDPKKDIIKEIVRGTEAEGKEILDYDLFFASDEKPFEAGVEKELLCSPRIDNLSSVLASIEALAACRPRATAVAAVFDNEEIGSATKQGADSTFLYDTVRRINEASGKFSLEAALCDSFMLSLDNSHAIHPNRPEKSDPTNKCYMGKGVTIKRHANQSYTGDGVSCSVIKQVFKNAGVAVQDFYNRSDGTSGSTLGKISSSHLSVRSVDMGIASLAMHSACETIAIKDYENMLPGLIAFYNAVFEEDTYDSVRIL